MLQRVPGQDPHDFTYAKADTAKTLLLPEALLLSWQTNFTVIVERLREEFPGVSAWTWCAVCTLRKRACLCDSGAGCSNSMQLHGLMGWFSGWQNFCLGL